MMRSREVFGILVNGIFNILVWKFGVPHKRGHPRIFPDALPEKMFFRIFKKSKRSENGHPPRNWSGADPYLRGNF